MSLAPLKERSQYSYTGRMHMRHGECKTPGGKLVAVNVAVDEDGTIKSCHISGDFFIEPDVTTSTRFAGAPASIGGNATDREPLNLLISPALLSPSTPSIAV